MHRLKRILLATDFSRAADNAGELAALLAEHDGAELHVYYAHVPQPWAGRPSQSASLGIGGIARVDESIYAEDSARLERYYPGRDVRVVHAIERQPSIGAGIAAYAEAHGVDLVAVGTHARRGAVRLFLGSVAEAVMRSAPVPVLVSGAKHRLPAAGLRTIVVPVDFSEASAHALRQAAELAASHDAALVVAYVVDDTEVPPYADMAAYDHPAREHAREALAAFVEAAALPVAATPVIARGRPHREIPGIARDHGADLLVMGTAAPCPVLAHRRAPDA